MSFAIFETGGKQYKASASKILEVEKLKAEKKRFLNELAPKWDEEAEKRESTYK